LDDSETENLDDARTRNAISQLQSRLERSYDRARATLLQIRKEHKTEAVKQASTAEVKQQAKEVVTEALQLSSAKARRP